MAKEIQVEYVNSHASEETKKDFFWYKQPDDAQHNSIFSSVDKIDKSQSYRNTMNIKHARLYNNLELLGYSIHSTGSMANVSNSDLNSGRVTYNLVKSCIDTASSKIAKNKPKPQFLTSGGD